jgi:hypothetical protein
MARSYGAQGTGNREQATESDCNSAKIANKAKNSGGGLLFPVACSLLPAYKQL